ncbi:MAG: DNRLRE domain-containing protein [Planctomycetes bacterium]|nr:DNRLRE domain-containing protein [Planctomycetota bacterium]
MNVSPRRVVVLSCLVGALGAAAANAQQSITIVCGRDNTLYQDSGGSFSNGIGDSVFCGVTALARVRRTLLHFDVAGSFAPGTKILAASLRLQVIFSAAPGATPVGVHRVLQGWGEGTSFATAGGGGMGAPSTVGDATWLHTSHATSFWSTPGGDYVPAPTCTLSMPVGGAFSSDEAAAGALADELQRWLDGSVPNHGWLLKTDEVSPSARARRLASRESGGSGPELVVDFLAPGQTGVWGTGCGALAPTTQWLGVPAPGGAVVLEDTATVGSVGWHAFAFRLVPGGVALATGCSSYLPLDELIVANSFVVGPSGVETLVLPIPVGLPPMLLVAQTAMLDPAGPLGLAPGNAALLVTQ